MTSSADPVSSGQYSENVRGPPPAAMARFPGDDEARRADGAVFPLLPPAFGADFAANQRTHHHGLPFQTSSSSGFQLREDDAGQRNDRTNDRTTVFSSSPSLYLPAHVQMSALDERGDRRCRSYSPSTFEQRLVRPAVASVQSQATSYDDHGVAVVSPPTPEPQPALRGDLPLDLTAKARTGDPLTTPEAGSWSPDDVTAYRPRRRYETWKQGTRPRSGEPASVERKNSDDSAASDFKPEVGGVTQSRPEPEIGVERAPTATAASPAKRSRLSTDDDGPVSEVATGSPAADTDGALGAGRYQCSHCEIEFFGSRVLHAMHMAFHGPVDPFQCSQCGVRTADRVEFFLHLARAAHS